MLAVILALLQTAPATEPVRDAAVAMTAPVAPATLAAGDRSSTAPHGDARQPDECERRRLRHGNCAGHRGRRRGDPAAGYAGVRGDQLCRPQGRVWPVGQAGGAPALRRGERSAGAVERAVAAIWRRGTDGHGHRHRRDRNAGVRHNRQARADGTGQRTDRKGWTARCSYPKARARTAARRPALVRPGAAARHGRVRPARPASAPRS